MTIYCISQIHVFEGSQTFGRRCTGVCAQHPHTYGTLLATGSYSNDKWPGCHSIILCVRQPNKFACTLALHRCLLHWVVGCHSSMCVGAKALTLRITASM